MVIRVLRCIWKACPLLMALLCTGVGLHVFREVPPEVQQGTGVRAAAIFRTAMLVLLWRVRIYPKPLKKLGRFMQFIIEFLLSMFIVEYLQADFWLPLEAIVKKLMGKLKEVADNSLQLVSIEATEYTDYISNEWTICFVVYGISLFFFISALHGVKIIDLREAKYGPEPFFYAVIQAYRKFLELRRNQRKRNTVQRQNIKKGYACDVDGRRHQKSVKWKKSDQNSIEGSRNDQDSIEWRKESDSDLTCVEDYSDFEM